MRRLWWLDDPIQVDLYQQRVRLGLVQQLRDGVAVPLVPSLWESVLVMSGVDDDHDGGCRVLVDPDERAAWLAIGGYVASADGLSFDEAQALAASAAGPDLSAREAAKHIELGALASSAPNTAELVKQTDVGVRIECLLEIVRAVAVDGMSEAEWARLREVGARLLGPTRVDALVRLCNADLAARAARSELLS